MDEIAMIEARSKLKEAPIPAPLPRPTLPLLPRPTSRVHPAARGLRAGRPRAPSRSPNLAPIHSARGCKDRGARNLF